MKLLVDRYLRAPAAGLKPVLSTVGKSGLNGGADNAVALKNHENGVGRADHYVRRVLLARAGVEFDLGATGCGEHPCGVTDCEVAPDPDREMHAIG